MGGPWTRHSPSGSGNIHNDVHLRRHSLCRNATLKIATFLVKHTALADLRAALVGCFPRFIPYLEGGMRLLWHMTLPSGDRNRDRLGDLTPELAQLSRLTDKKVDHPGTRAVETELGNGNGGNCDFSLGCILHGLALESFPFPRGFSSLCFMLFVFPVCSSFFFFQKSWEVSPHQKTEESRIFLWHQKSLVQWRLVCVLASVELW